MPKQAQKTNKQKDDLNYVQQHQENAQHIMLVTMKSQPRTFFGRTDAEAEAPILWPPDAKNRFIGKDPDAGKD